MKTLTSIKTLLASALLIPVFSIAQVEHGTGLFTPGTSFEMQMINGEPTCWVNAANEVNAYINDAEGVKLITLQSNDRPDIGELPKMNRVTYSSHGFMLHSENGTNYFFGLDELESKQVLDIMKYTVKGDVKTFNGYGVAQHSWPAGKAPDLKELQAANSIYDVLGQ